jgi:hypothetical protein
LEWASPGLSEGANKRREPMKEKWQKCRWSKTAGKDHDPRHSTRGHLDSRYAGTSDQEEAEMLNLILRWQIPELNATSLSTPAPSADNC